MKVKYVNLPLRISCVCKCLIIAASRYESTVTVLFSLMQSCVSFQFALSSCVLTENGSAPPGSGEPLVIGDRRTSEEVSLWGKQGEPSLTFRSDCF